eukprot:s1811_g8.t1
MAVPWRCHWWWVLFHFQAAAAAVDVPFCDAQWLSVVGCPPEEHGISWEAFLIDACRNCVPDEPCQLDFQDTAFKLAQEITSSADDVVQSFRCAPGLLSAMIIIAQYFLVKEPVPEVLELLGKVASLAPFPFFTSQYSRYANMVSLGLLMCNPEQHKSPRIYNRYVPRVHAEDSGLCGLVYTDDQLVRRCRSFRKNAAVAKRVEDTQQAFDSWPTMPNPSCRGRSDSIQCPTVDQLQVEEQLGKKIRKYEDRANSLQCQDSRGMWHQAMSDVHKCVLISVGHWLRFRPGELVLDWGSGCGHKLSWAKMLFDVDGIGVEIQVGCSLKAGCQAKTPSGIGRPQVLLIFPVPPGRWLFEEVASTDAHLEGLDARDTAFMARLRALAQEALTWPHLSDEQRLKWATVLQLDVVPLQEMTQGMSVDLLSLDGRLAVRCSDAALPYSEVKRFLRVARWVYEARSGAAAGRSRRNEEWHDPKELASRL